MRSRRRNKRRRRCASSRRGAGGKEHEAYLFCLGCSLDGAVGRLEVIGAMVLFFFFLLRTDFLALELESFFLFCRVTGVGGGCICGTRGARCPWRLAGGFPYRWRRSLQSRCSDGRIDLGGHRNAGGGRGRGRRRRNFCFFARRRHGCGDHGSFFDGGTAALRLVVDLDGRGGDGSSLDTVNGTFLTSEALLNFGGQCRDGDVCGAQTQPAVAMRKGQRAKQGSWRQSSMATVVPSRPGFDGGCSRHFVSFVMRTALKPTLHHSQVVHHGSGRARAAA